MPLQIPSTPVGRLGEAWRSCVGTGRFELSLRRDHHESLRLVQSEIGFQRLRGHGLFGDGVGVHRPYEHAGARHVRYAFGYVDQVLDAHLALGLRPFVELGFMPSGLASGDRTVFWWQGNITPPRSHREWADLVQATVRHLVDRYGIAEARTWPIEVWNEPNLDTFWPGADEAAYHRFYEVTARAVKDVDGSLQVGGPAISPGADAWLTRFAEFAAARDVPVDFVSKHAYTSSPAQEVPFATHQTLRPASDLLDQFATPRRLLHGTVLADLPVHVTEFNSSYRPDNPVHDTAFHAAYLAPVVAGGGEHVDSFSYWTFCDVFEEVGVPTTLFHGGFGLLTHRQVKKPTYHLYAFMARMGDHVLARGDDHLVTRDDGGRVTVLAWSPVDVTDVAGSPERHELHLSLPVGGPGTSAAFVLRRSVSEEDGNAHRAWTELGRPPSPTEREFDVLREAAEPGRRHASVPVTGGRADLRLTLGRHEVTLVEVTPVVDRTPPWWDDARLLGGPPSSGEAAP